MHDEKHLQDVSSPKTEAHHESRNPQTIRHALGIETVPNPVLGTGEVIVDVVATPILAYAGEIYSGARNYLLDLPVVPGSGSIGRVKVSGPDSTRCSPAIGYIAIRLCARATMCCHLTSHFSR